MPPAPSAAVIRYGPREVPELRLTATALQKAIEE
jgi:hypothetical protein